MSSNGILHSLQVILGVRPENRGSDMHHFLETIRQEDPPTPRSARQYDHSSEDFVGLGVNRRPRAVVGDDGRTRKLHDRNGQLCNVAPGSTAEFSPKWFSARSVSGALRSLISWGFPWVRNEVLAESWGQPFLWDDASVELCSVAAFNKSIVDVPCCDSARDDSIKDDLAVRAYVCGFFLSRDLAYFCDVCTCVVSMSGLTAEAQIYSLRKHFASGGHCSNQGSLPGRANRGRLSVFPYFFIDHECFKSHSAREFMDNLQSSSLNSALKKFASVLRENLRPGTHFVYIHKGLGRFFCLSRREWFAPSANYRGGSTPFVLEEGTCPYNRSIDMALRRLIRVNFGQPRSTVGDRVETDTSTRGNVIASASPPVQPSESSAHVSAPAQSALHAFPPPPPQPVPPAAPDIVRGSVGPGSRPARLAFLGGNDDDGRKFLPSSSLPPSRPDTSSLVGPDRRHSVPPSAPIRLRNVETFERMPLSEHRGYEVPSGQPQPLPAPSSVRLVSASQRQEYRYDAAVELQIRQSNSDRSLRPVGHERVPQEVPVQQSPPSSRLDTIMEEPNWFPSNMAPLEQGMVMLTSLAAIDEDGSVRPDMIPAQLDLYSFGHGVRMPGRLMFAATMAIQIPLVEGTEFAALDASTFPALPIGRRRPEEQALQDLLDASPSAPGIDDSVNWREFDVRSLANTEAETEIINLTLESLPVSEDLDGFVPPHRPEDRTTFDWDIDSTIRRSGMNHPGWTSPWPFRPGPYLAWRMVALKEDDRSARGDMRYLLENPWSLSRDQVLNGEWGRFWRGFHSPRGCASFLDSPFVAFKHPLVAGVVPSLDENVSARLMFLHEIGPGPTRGHNTREEAWPEKPYVASAAAILRWLHSAQLGALCATIHCAGGHTQGTVRSECSVLFCCEQHLEDSLVSVMRLSRERPLMPNSYVFSARSVRAFECNLLDEQGRPSGLDRPESLVDMLYKFESVRARDGHPLPRTPLTPFPEPFSLRSGEIVDAPATGINRPRRSERYSLNYNWSQISDNFEDVARPVLEHWSKKDEDFRPRED